METNELNARLLADARLFDPKARPSSKLIPHRNVILLYRAKGMSYERIAAAFLVLPEEDGNCQVLEFTWERLEGRPIDEIANDLLDRIVEVCEEEADEEE